MLTRRNTSTTRTIPRSRKFYFIPDFWVLIPTFLRHFSEVNNEATDEVWYERAVEYHFNNPNSFVFSVPFDIGDKRPTTVTATHAIFKDQGGRKAPAAVVGVQIDYDRFAETFMDVTTNGPTGAGYQVCIFQCLDN